MNNQPGEALGGALSYMEAALKLLDKCDAPADIGAHLDMAICRLRDVLSQKGVRRSASPEDQSTRED